MEGLIADRYEVLGSLGEGLLGEVYRVLDREDGSEKALKLLKPTGLAHNSVQRFRREYRVISALRHPNVIVVHDIGVHYEDGAERPYFSMELLAGSDLGRWCAANRPVTGHPGFDVYAGHVAYLLHQICDALHAVHEAGVVHRDIKPANIFVRPGRFPRAKLLDFGHARAEEEGENLTQTGTVLGTATYMAPEQATGEPPAPAADLYAIGCVLHEALTGKPPFPGSNAVQVLLGHIRKPPPDPREREPRAPDALADLCMRLLAKSPAERPVSARAVALELSAL